MARSVKLAIVDDHPLFRDGVAYGLAQTEGFEICGQGSSAADAIRLAAIARLDILLLDLRIPGGGLNALQLIHSRTPDLKIVILTSSNANDDAIASLNAGAKGYVLKEVGLRTLADILRRVSEGETHVSPEVAASMVASLQDLNASPARDSPLAVLTPRQRQILEFVANGLSNKEVAIQLDLHDQTVKHHMTRIMSKLNVRNRTEAAMLLRAQQ
jgi:two-component system, NarL family, nitrate/nitrite response regulator NarL